MDVAENVHLVGGPELTDPRDALAYLVVGVEASVLIDSGAGPSSARILENVERIAGRGPDHLFLTHAHIDHAGGAAAIKRQSRCLVHIHQAEAGVMESGDRVRSAAGWYGLDLEPLAPDRILGDQGSIDLGRGSALNLIHTPGHTPGSMAAWLDTGGKRVLFGQDIHGPFAPEFGSDREEWAKSMERLLALEADILAEGHFGLIRPGKRVREFILEHLAANGFGKGKGGAD